MKELLRLISGDRIRDYSTSDANAPIMLNGVSFVSSGSVWNFEAWTPVYWNGKESRKGSLKAGDILIIDRKYLVAAMILEELPARPQVVEFTKIMTIGRGKENHLVFENPMISTRHCQILEDNGKFFIRDMGSTNGTYVNDIRVRECLLKEGDSIKIGCYLLKLSGKIILVNGDQRVSAHDVRLKFIKAGKMKFRADSYPWFSPAPRVLPHLPALSVTIEDAPTISKKPSMGIGAVVLDPAMMAISLGMQALRFGIGKYNFNKQDKKRAEIYATYLAGIEKQLNDHGEAQRKLADLYHPTLGECILRGMERRQTLWEKHKEDEDFLTLRLGTGTVLSKAVIEIPPQRLQLEEDPLDKVPGQIKEKYQKISDVAVCCDLIKDGNLGLIGNRTKLIAMCRSFLIQLSALHSYEEVRIVILYHERERGAWEFARWLPHCMSDDRKVRFLACESDHKYVLEQLDDIAKKRIENQNQWSFGKDNSGKPHYVFVVSNSELLINTSIGTALMMNQPELGISGIFIGSSMADFPHSIRNIATYRDMIELRAGDRVYEINPDPSIQKLTDESCDKYARSLAPVRLLGEQSKKQGIPSLISLFDGLHIDEVKNIALEEMWEGNLPEKSLSVPIGVKSGGELFYFDIHQSAHGPHGMVAGGTGSGKSQLAQTWIISMAMHFSPRDVQFVLVDFKGESLLAPFLKLPHLAGSISNLDHDVARNFKAMESELQRRQRVLGEYGCTDIIAYQEKARRDRSMPSLPYLILVVDEFAEFKQQFPDFTASLDHLYRGGRSLGMFVILMTQAPAGIVTDQMRANANFRWCLSVRSEADSREMIGTSEASEIRIPGRVYIKTKDGCELVQSLYAGCAYRQEEKEQEDKTLVYHVDTDGERKVGLIRKEETGFYKTQLDVLVEHIADFCDKHGIPSAKPLWTKELPEVVDVFDLTEGDVLEQKTAVFGIVDDPENQEQYHFVHTFEKDGNIAVYGTPYSGKTTFLQTGIVSMCSRYLPDQVQFYLMDVGGFSLRPLERFPHVGVASGDDEPEVLEKEINLLLDILRERKRKFRMESVGTVAGYELATGKTMPICILAVDNVNLLSMQMPQVFDGIIKIAREGSAYGLYLMCSFAGISGINYQLTQNIKTLAALQLPDKADYTGIVGRISKAPDMVIGRGMVKTIHGPKMFQTAIVFGDASENERFMSLRKLADHLNTSYDGIRPEKVKIMPEYIEYGDLPTDEPLMLGLESEEITPVRFPLNRNCSLLISAGTERADQGLVSLLLRELSEQEDAEILFYTERKSVFFGSTVTQNITVVSDMEEFEKKINEVAVILRQRQAAKKEDAQSQFSPIVIFVDSYYDMVKQAVGDVIARLEVFIRLGDGLAITIIGADLAAKMGKARFEADLLTQTMRKGPALLIGGGLLEHQVADTYEFNSKHPRALKEDEACLIQENLAVFLKVMQSE